MKKKISSQRKQVIVCIIAFAVALAIAFFVKATYTPFLLVLVSLAAFILIVVFGNTAKKRPEKAVKALCSFLESNDKYVNAQIIPCVVTDKDGIILESNAEFSIMANSKCIGENLFSLIEDVSDPLRKHITVNEKQYRKEFYEHVCDGETFNIFCFIDENKIIETGDFYKTMLGVAAVMQIDNLDDLLRSVPKAEHSSIMLQIDNLIASASDNIGGLYQQFAQDKYLLVFERRKLAVFMENKFDILNRIKNIATSSTERPTLSIGVGARSSLKSSMDSALAALELALSRGGDQAVIKERQGYKFYGGGQQAPEIRVRVRARMFAKKLRTLMENCSNIVVTGHVFPDLDCMGAALGVCACAKYVNKKANIVLDKPNAAISELVAELKNDSQYKDLIVSFTEADKIVTESSMLVIVDTQFASQTLAPQLIAKTKNIVIIDHHLKGTACIENASLMYHEPYASSASEMVCEVVQYFSEHLHLKPLEAEALLAGITIDTKGFSFKSGARTFEAAAYLKKNGADTTTIRHLFQDDIDTFSNRANVVRSAEIVRDGIAVAYCPEGIENAQLIAAQAADSLLSIRGVKASFVFSRNTKETCISGRSFGQINVQRILEKLGGGGHGTMAGAQVSDKIDAAKEKLIAAIDEYFKEG